MFFPATSTVGKTFLNLEGCATVAGVDEVSSMGGDYRNMKMVGYKGGVRVLSCCSNCAPIDAFLLHSFIPLF
jgi:hypothetical protein